MASGLDPAAFWEITPREVMVILDGADARMERDLRLAQGMAYSTAVLVGIAFNNPKAFPKFDKVFRDKPAAKAVQEPDAIFAAMSAWAEAAPLIDPVTLMQPETS